MHQIQTALFQGHFVSWNEEIFLYLWVQSRATILPKKRGVFQSLTAAVNILPEMCQKNPNFRSLVCRLERKKKLDNNYKITENSSDNSASTSMTYLLEQSDAQPT